MCSAASSRWCARADAARRGQLYGVSQTPAGNCAEIHVRPLKKALEDRLAALDRSGSWPDLIADLDALTDTEIEHDGKRFVVRSAPRPAASLALRAAGVALPPTVRQATAS